MKDESITWPFLLGLWKQPFPGTNLPAQDARDRLSSFKDASRLLHPRDRRHYCSRSGMSPVRSSRAKLQKSQHSHQRFFAGKFNNFSLKHQPLAWKRLDCLNMSRAGFHLPPVLEEQGSTAENPNGGHQKSFPFSLREQHQEASQALRWL